jgi:hypothetical protein
MCRYSFERQAGYWIERVLGVGGMGTVSGGHPDLAASESYNRSG